MARGQTWQQFAMLDPIIKSEKPVAIIGGGEITPDCLKLAFANDGPLVAADGGAEVVLKGGRVPDAVIGDFDSLSAEARAEIPADRLHEVSEQDSTDFEKCVMRIDAPFILATGFAGDRLDHGLAALSVLARRLGPPTFLIGPDDFAFAAPDALEIKLDPGTCVSLFPMAPVTGTSAGLKWPIDGLTLDPMGRTGTSNEATGQVQLRFNEPGCLIILPRAALPKAIQALTG